MSSSAKDKNNKIVYGCDLGSDDQSVDRTKPLYKCRSCGANMSLVISSNRVTHFRHYPNDERGIDCIMKNNGQSDEHYRAKDFFYDVYNNHPDYKCAVQEHIIYDDYGDVLRIGDVVIYPNNQDDRPTVIEIQNSSMKPSDINRRTKDWNDNGYDVMWIVTYKGMYTSGGRINGFASYVKDICLGILHIHVYDADDKELIDKYKNGVLGLYGSNSVVDDFRIVHVPITYGKSNYMLSMVNDIRVSRLLDDIELERKCREEAEQKEAERVRAIEYERIHEEEMQLRVHPSDVERSKRKLNLKFSSSISKEDDLSYRQSRDDWLSDSIFPDAIGGRRYNLCSSVSERDEISKIMSAPDFDYKKFKCFGNLMIANNILRNIRKRKSIKNKKLARKEMIDKVRRIVKGDSND